MLRKLTATSATWAMLPLRLALGTIFIAHGAQKVFGSFEGPGLRTFMNFPPPYSFMRPGWLWMGAAAVSELLGGILVLLGLFTRVGAFLIFCIMLTAMLGVHWSKGFFMSNQGVEFTLALLGMSLALLVAGGGQASADKLISRR